MERGGSRYRKAFLMAALTCALFAGCRSDGQKGEASGEGLTTAESGYPTGKAGGAELADGGQKPEEGAESESAEDKKESRAIEPMEAEEACKLTFDITGGEDAMPISGFYGPYPSCFTCGGERQPELIDDGHYQLIADCGVRLINYSHIDYSAQPDAVMRMLELGEEYGVGLFVTDTSVYRAQLSDEEVLERIGEYSESSAFCGMFVVDEPSWSGFVAGDGTRDIDDLIPAYEQFHRLGIVASNNLFPVYASRAKGKYGDYVEKFLSSCPVPYVSFDNYVFDKGNNVPDYFNNLSVVREKAQKYGIPFWTFIQAGSQWGINGSDSATPYYPDEGQFAWNVNTSLAYGSKGIEYFPLVQPDYFAQARSTEYDFERNGILGAWGNTTQWYDYAKRLAPHLAAIDEVLVNSVSKGVLVSGKQAGLDNTYSACVLEGTCWRELEAVEGNALIGCFNYQGQTALYVVNYDYEDSQEIELCFYDDCSFFMIQNAERREESGESISLSMEAGEGILIVFASTARQ